MELNPYARFLGDADPVVVLTTTSERLHALIDPLPPTRVNEQPAPGKWSIREIVSHLADCEVVFCFRLRQTLAEDHHIIQPFDQERWAQRYGAYQIDQALALFEAARNWNLRLLTTVQEEDRHRHVTHPERGTMTFWTIVETMAGHDINHLLQIEHLVAKP
ncbi:DinB family protein [Edaphobacter bradus]|uniref:DinB family protein n=1 Tax=Edaphobacter bradus TaxID=2259016 RepID=UPI0021E02CBA|nr:DinB family protein [Edaphobacter bradus]